MSVEQQKLEDDVKNYLRNFPFGKTRDELCEEFDAWSEQDVETALSNLEEDDVILNVGGKYRWTR